MSAEVSAGVSAEVSPARVDGFPSSDAHLLAELARVDALLQAHVAVARPSVGDPADALGAFVVGEAEVDTLVATPLGVPLWAPGGRPADADADDARRRAQNAAGAAASLERGVPLRLETLVRACALTPFERDVVLTCLAPEVDRRYERLYAYLHDDVTRRAPTVDLLLGLLCADLPARTAARERLAPTAPLRRHRLVHLEDDPQAPAVSLLDRAVRLDPHVAGFLLGADDLDPQLGASATLHAGGPGTATLVLPEAVAAEVRHLVGLDGPLVVVCRGDDGVGRCAVARACAADRARPLLELDTAGLAEGSAEDFAVRLAVVDREARLRGAVRCWRGADALAVPERRRHLELLVASAAEDLVFLAGGPGWEPDARADGVPVVRLDVPRPGHADRVRLWEAALAATPVEGDVDTAQLASFRLSGGRIRDAVATASGIARLRGAAAPGQEDLHAACRRHARRILTSAARHVPARHGWDDLVLPPERLAQLRDIRDQVHHRPTVHERWGFERRLSRGLNVLFTGPSGTGKTMAADVLAGSLGLDLYAVDLSAVVSRFVGETEKALERLFDEARDSHAMLFFDEADALFGKRTQVRDAHDRYANIETSYLLQRLEEHDGVVVLATNLRQNMDDAFVRRLHATVEFPFPDVAERRRLWAGLWPAEAPLAPDVDLDALAQHVDLAGGHLRTIALAAAFLAAADGGVITTQHVALAARREYQKVGKVLPERVLEPIAGLLGAQGPNPRAHFD